MKALSAFFLSSLLGLSACSIISRSDNSGYNDLTESGPSTIEDFYRERKAKVWQETKEDLSIPAGAELGENEIQNIRTRIELNRLEKKLQSDIEKKQYFTLKPFFNNDSERVYYLKLPTQEARERWSNSRGISSVETAFNKQDTALIEKNDIAKGMSKNAVTQSWGEPDFVEVAGNSLYGNERWRYNKLVSTEEGYKNEMRFIYFDSGRVVGWETK
jgi:hypothetical protein